MRLVYFEVSQRKKDAAALIRLTEDYPEVCPLRPEELRRQLLGQN